MVDKHTPGWLNDPIKVSDRDLPDWLREGALGNTEVDVNGIPTWLTNDEAKMPPADKERWAQIVEDAQNFAKAAMPMEDEPKPEADMQEDLRTSGLAQVLVDYRNLSLAGRHREAAQVWKAYKAKQ